jgi:c-di-GMP-binding flagellar brake protein YcgR
MPLIDDEIILALRSGIDRREFKRVVFHGYSELLLPNHDVMKVRTMDISRGGVGVVSSLNLLPGMPCRVNLHFRKIPFGMENIVVEAQIAHCVLSGKEQGFLIGLQFVDPSPEALDAVDRYIKSKSHAW